MSKLIKFTKQLSRNLYYKFFQQKLSTYTIQYKSYYNGILTYTIQAYTIGKKTRLRLGSQKCQQDGVSVFLSSVEVLYFTHKTGHKRHVCKCFIRVTATAKEKYYAVRRYIDMDVAAVFYGLGHKSIVNSSN